MRSTRRHSTDKTVNKGSKLTKREFLSFISSIYDPIGIISQLMLEVNHSRTLEEKSSMGQTAIRGYKAKMDCLE